MKWNENANTFIFIDNSVKLHNGVTNYWAQRSVAFKEVATMRQLHTGTGYGKVESGYIRIYGRIITGDAADAWGLMQHLTNVTDWRRQDTERDRQTASMCVCVCVSIVSMLYSWHFVVVSFVFSLTFSVGSVVFYFLFLSLPLLSVPIYEIYFLPTLWLFIQNVETTDTICQGLRGWHGQPSAGGRGWGMECTEWNFGQSVLNKWITQFMHDEHL